MKPLTSSDLQSILDSELIWRRKEITTLVTAVGLSDASAKVAFIRSSVPLLYAHWEGFGRECFQRYMEHVSFKSLKYSSLQPSFLYLASLAKMQEIGRSPAKVAVPLVSPLLLIQSKPNRNAFRRMIDTKSNLRFEVLESLCALCGLDSSSFEPHKDLIDQEICDPRNEIAHGSGAAPTIEVFTKRRDRAFGLMTQLQALVVNASVNGDFKAT